MLASVCLRTGDLIQSVGMWWYLLAGRIITIVFFLFPFETTGWLYVQLIRSMMKFQKGNLRCCGGILVEMIEILKLLE